MAGRGTGREAGRTRPGIRGVWLGAGAAVAAALALGGCMAPKPRELDAGSGMVARIARDQELVVNLDSNSATGFRWLLQARESAVLQQLGEPVYEPRKGDPRLVGSGGLTRFRFRAIAPGRETLIFTYRRPWEMNLPPARMVRYEITVE
jgi:inhibitor of cysteine peptidase